jgi:cation diffusion facilitator family transporter
MNDEADLAEWTHVHIFDEADLAAERSTRTVMLITAAMMVVEIFAGWWFNSMALLADGWHMSSHALAIGLSMVAYMASRRYARDPHFAFGTWKIEVLAGYSSALFLLGIAAWMVAGSVERLWRPQPIHFLEAIVVAALGLIVNIVCAAILGGPHAHGHHHHGHDHAHDHHHHHDLNLRAAYVHVITDAATSVLAIFALLGGMLLGWNWLDPAMGIVGAALVAFWARGLIRDTGGVLLDREMHHPVVAEVKDAIRSHPDWARSTGIADLHVWRVGRQRYACILSLVTDDPAVTPQAVKAALAQHEELVHVTVEINPSKK